MGRSYERLIQLGERGEESSRSRGNNIKKEKL